MLVVGPPLSNSGGIGALFSYLAETPSSKIERIFLDSRGNHPYPLISLLRLPLVLLHILFLHKRNLFKLAHINISGGASTVRKIIISNLLIWLRRPIIIQLHSSSFHIELANSHTFFRKIVINTINRASAVLVFGDVWRDELVKLGVESGIIHKISMGVPDLRNRSNHLDGIESSSKDCKHIYIAFCAPLTPAKGFPLLISALSEVNSYNFRLIVLGDGDLDFWRRICETNGIDAVFCGKVDLGLVNKILPLCDIFCLPSKAENLPVSVLEAASAEVPILVSDVGAIVEYFDSTQVTYISNAEPAELTAALKHFSSKPSVFLEKAVRAKAVWKDSFEVSHQSDKLESFWMKYISD